jgi:hypothetical protein
MRLLSAETAKRFVDSFEAAADKTAPRRGSKTGVQLG